MLHAINEGFLRSVWNHRYKRNPPIVHNKMVVLSPSPNKKNVVDKAGTGRPWGKVNNITAEITLIIMIPIT